METSRIINATADMNYVIPAIMVKKYAYKYYYVHAVHIGVHHGVVSSSFCGQEHISTMTEVSVEEAPKITCSKCLHILWNLTYGKTDTKEIHEAISDKLGARLQMVHVKKERSNKSNNSEPVNPLEEEPVDRLLSPPSITEIPIAYHRDKACTQRAIMLEDFRQYLFRKYNTYKPLYDHAMKLQAFGFTTSFVDVINDYNRDLSNLNVMIAELTNTIAKGVKNENTLSNMRQTNC